MTMSSGATGPTPAPGAKVITSDGDELGTVKEVEGFCFKVDAPMRPDYWLGSDCVASADTGEVRLNIAKDQVGDAKTDAPDHSGIQRHGA